MVRSAKQLDLTMTPRLSYATEGFYLHSGVKQIEHDLLSFIETDSFPIVSVIGPARCGKTHFSIYLYETLLKSGKDVHLFEGEEFYRQLSEMPLAPSSGSKRFFLVDDADDCLMKFEAGASGALVRLVEHFRQSGGFLIYFRSRELEDYPFDEHLRSRFLAGAEFSLGEPDRDELYSLLQLLIKQRGIKLSERKLRFLSKRLPPSLLHLEEYVDRMIELSRLRGSGYGFTILGDAL